MFEFLSAGILLDLAAGFAPRPLLVLVISETLRHNIKAGIKVSIAPLITDIPIIVLSLFVLNRLANFKAILGCISIFGGLFTFYLVGSKVLLAMVLEKSRSFLKGPVYIWVMRILGILLLIFSMVLFRDGLRLLAAI